MLFLRNIHFLNNILSLIYKTNINDFLILIILKYYYTALYNIK